MAISTQVLVLVLILQCVPLLRSLRMIRFVAPQGSARTRSAGAGTSALSLANCAGWSSRYSHSYRHSNSNGYGNRYGVARVPLYLCSGSSVGRGRDSMVSTSSAAADKLARTYSARLSSNSPGEKLPHSNSYGYRNDTSLAASTATHPAPSDWQGRAVALPSKGAGGRVTIDIPSEAELQMLENELTSGKWASPAFIPLGGKTHMADTVSSKAVDRAAAISAGTATSSAATVVKPKAAVASKSQPKKAASSNSSSTKSIATVVTTVARAREVLRAMQTYPDAIWACDTEVAMLDVKKQGPVGNGKVVCVSLYGGDHIDFDRFAAHPSSSNVGTALFIDNMQEEGVLEVFKEWFEDSSVKKVWHNYGFDRHVLFNEGVDARGFAGDTMHMARLFDTSRDKGVAGGEGYSLASLSEDFFSNNLYSGGNKDKGGGSSASKVFDSRLVKTSMKELFGVAKLKKDGEESKVKVLPEILDIHTNTTGQRDLWIEYSAKDAIATWWIRDTLETKLLSMHWVVDGKILGNMYDFYKRYLVDFGELLTDLERVGIKVDTKNHLKEAERLARIERNRLEQVFLKWARQFCDNIEYLNIASTVQMQQLLFGTYEGGVLVESEKVFYMNLSSVLILDYLCSFS